MKLKQLIKSYSFWTALAGALVVLVQVICKIFKVEFESNLISDFVMAIAGVLVVFGVVTLPKTLQNETSSIEENQIDSSKNENESRQESDNETNKLDK